MLGFDPMDTEIDKQIVDVSNKKTLAEIKLEQKYISRNEHGLIVIDYETQNPARLTINEVSELKEDIRNYERLLNDLKIRKYELLNSKKVIPDPEILSQAVPPNQVIFIWNNISINQLQQTIEI